MSYTDCPSKAILFHYNTMVNSGVFEYKENYIPPLEKVKAEFVINDELDAFYLKCLQKENERRGTNFRFTAVTEAGTIEKMVYTFEHFVEKVTFPDFKGGHMWQRLQKFFWGDYDLKPRPFYRTEVSEEGFYNEIALSIDHLTDKTIKKLLDFCRHSNYTFKLFSELDIMETKEFENYSNLSVEDEVSEMQSCMFFIGNEKSVFSHYAAGMDKKIVTISELSASKLYIPVILNPEYNLNLAAIFPQATVICSDGKNENVPELSNDSLSNALSGYIYPYFSDEYLNIVKYLN